MARRERDSIDGGWIGKCPDRTDEGWRTAALPQVKTPPPIEVEDNPDYVLYYAAEEDGTISAYWRKERIGFVR